MVFCQIGGREIVHCSWHRLDVGCTCHDVVAVLYEAFGHVYSSTQVALWHSLLWY